MKSKKTLIALAMTAALSSSFMTNLAARHTH
jgi:hypothetical protein